MQRSYLLFFSLVLIVMAACSNGQNDVAEGASDGDITKTEAAKEKIQQLKAPSSKTTNTPSQKTAVQRPKFRVEDKNGNIFSGEFAYMADAAYFINCSTGNRYSVVMKDAFVELEKSYLKLVGVEAGKRVYAVFEGEFLSKSNNKDDLMKGTLLVKKMISLSDEAGCQSVVRKMGGMYAVVDGIASFTDCKNKRTYAVQSTAAFKELEKAYQENAKTAGEKIYVELSGFSKMLEEKDGGAAQTGLVVTRVIGFDATYSCE